MYIKWGLENEGKITNIFCHKNTCGSKKPQLHRQNPTVQPINIKIILGLI